MPRARAEDMQEKGITGEELRAVQDDVEKAERAVREAGGWSTGRLHLEVLKQGRYNKRKEDAIDRHNKKLEELRAKRDEAIAAVADAESKHVALRSEWEDGKRRYAYLASQQAAESRPVGENLDVRRALAVVNGMGISLPPQLAGHLAVLERAVSRFYPGPEDIEAIISVVGLGADSDSEISAAEDYVDDEPEVTAEILHGRRDARQLFKGVVRERKAAIVEKVGEGGSAKAVYKLYANRIERAEAEVRNAEAALLSARNLACARIKRQEENATDGTKELDGVAAPVAASTGTTVQPAVGCERAADASARGEGHSGHSGK